MYRPVHALAFVITKPWDAEEIGCIMKRAIAGHEERSGQHALQKNIVSVALAAYGVLFSVALGKGGDQRVLLVIPPLGLVLCGLPTLVGNLLRYVADWKPTPRRTAVYAGEPAGKNHLESAGLTGLSTAARRTISHEIIFPTVGLRRFRAG